MVVVEQEHDEKAKWQCRKDPFDIQLPEMN